MKRRKPIIKLEVPGMPPRLVRKMERMVSDHLLVDPEFKKRCAEVLEKSFRETLTGIKTKP